MPEKRKSTEIIIGSKPKKRQRKISKNKRITRFNKSIIRKCGRKGSVSLGDGDQLGALNKNKKEVITL